MGWWPEHAGGSQPSSAFVIPHSAFLPDTHRDRVLRCFRWNRCWAVLYRPWVVARLQPFAEPSRPSPVPPRPSLWPPIAPAPQATNNIGAYWWLYCWWLPAGAKQGEAPLGEVCFWCKPLRIGAHLTSLQARRWCEREASTSAPGWAMRQRLPLPRLRTSFVHCPGPLGSPAALPRHPDRGLPVATRHQQAPRLVGGLLVACC